MKKTAVGWLALFLFLASAGPLPAHHSLTNYDTTKAVRVKGAIVQINLINPHSIIYLEERGADGQSRRWAAEGPGVLQLARTGFDKSTLKAGDVIEICGYLPKEPIMWQVASPDSRTASFAGRLINGEMMVMPDGTQRNWGDYGVHKCFAPGYSDQHSK